MQGGILQKIINSKSKTFFVSCFYFLLGVSLISIFEFKIDLVFVYSALFVLTSFLIIYWKNKKVRFVAFLIIFFILGIGRYVIAFPNVDSAKSIAHYNGEKKTVIGYVSAEPDVRLDGVRYIVNVNEGVGSFGSAQDRLNLPVQDNNLKGKIYFKSTLYPRYSYGDKLELRCSLRTPEPVEDFRYDMYLARYKVFSICQEPKIKKLEGLDGNKLLAGIFSLKEVVADRINKLWHEPQASFMAGLLYGYRGGLGELNELFSRTGVTHIVAISGYNITIIATILITICIHLYIPRKKAFWLITIGIALFVIFAGASASVVRAGIMGVIVLLAKQTGRVSKISNVLILTCVVMCLQNPFVLIWDAGFQLSFISTLGLVYLTPVIRNWFTKVPEVLGIRESLISTLCAIGATLPLILYQFGRLSIVAPIVNVVILWILPTIMIFGFFAVIISFLWFGLGELIAWIAWTGMQYIIVVVKWFANLNFAAVDFRIPVWAMIGLYVFMIYFIQRKNVTQDFSPETRVSNLKV